MARSSTAANSFGKTRKNFEPSAFFDALLKQVYLNSVYIPGLIHVPSDFESRDELEEFLTEKRGHKVEIHTPQRGTKKALLGLVENNQNGNVYVRLTDYVLLFTTASSGWAGLGCNERSKRAR